MIQIQHQEIVNLNDVVIDFTQEEWALLDAFQKMLFRDVMVENISHLLSVGNQICKSDVASKFNQVEKLLKEEIGFFQSQNSGSEGGFKKQGMLYMQHICRKDTFTITSLVRGPQMQSPRTENFPDATIV
ncbi:zinc finger protein 596-like [Choloepus didactylus]|uniref:zinc finger protein 596-like n=1 Tax=Choloepus didactylus TaxID=27675 RepID=UPI00189F66AE|nr:zinc finger protein 596-like [Choloepus didactylus]